jgi:hypothetical protein
MWQVTFPESRFTPSSRVLAQRKERKEDFLILRPRCVIFFGWKKAERKKENYYYPLIFIGLDRDQTIMMTQTQGITKVPV